MFSTDLLIFANQSSISVIPAKAGIHWKYGWIPVFSAGGGSASDMNGNDNRQVIYAKINKNTLKMKKFLKNKLPSFILLSFLLAVSTAFLTHPIVNSKEDQRHVRFGWPMWYIEQNQAFLDPPYPWKTSFSLFVDVVQTDDILWANFAVDTAFFLIVTAIIIGVIYYAAPNNRAWINYLRFRNIAAIPILIILFFYGMFVMFSLHNYIIMQPPICNPCKHDSTHLCCVGYTY